jgi:hypothetical protein
MSSPVADKWRAAPCISPAQQTQGEMWIRLAQKMASTVSDTPAHGACSTSSSIGGRTRAKPVHQAAIEGSEAASNSVGSHCQPGRPALQ